MGILFANLFAVFQFVPIIRQVSLDARDLITQTREFTFHNTESHHPPPRQRLHHLLTLRSRSRRRHHHHPARIRRPHRDSDSRRCSCAFSPHCLRHRLAPDQATPDRSASEVDAPSARHDGVNCHLTDYSAHCDGDHGGYWHLSRDLAVQSVEICGQ